MTEQEAFLSWSLSPDVTISRRDLPVARQAFQAGRAYEAKRVKKLVEAAQLALRKFELSIMAAHGNRCTIHITRAKQAESSLREALREYQGGE